MAYVWKVLLCDIALLATHCRIQRDVAVRGRDVGGVIEQYTKFVKPAFDQYVAPSRKFADIIIPWHRCNEACVAECC
jgi:uridine kinase